MKKYIIPQFICIIIALVISLAVFFTSYNVFNFYYWLFSVVLTAVYIPTFAVYLLRIRNSGDASRIEKVIKCVSLFWLFVCLGFLVSNLYIFYKEALFMYEVKSLNEFTFLEKIKIFTRRDVFKIGGWQEYFSNTWVYIVAGALLLISIKFGDSKKVTPIESDKGNNKRVTK